MPTFGTRVRAAGCTYEVLEQQYVRDRVPQAQDATGIDFDSHRILAVQNLSAVCICVHLFIFHPHSKLFILSVEVAASQGSLRLSQGPSTAKRQLKKQQQ